MKPRNPEHPECRAVSGTLQLVGDKWTVLVVSLLGDETMRFSELKRAIDGISQKMLTTTLRNLEQNGFVTRSVYPTIPPRVDYALTELGRDLLGPVHGLVDWARNNSQRMAAARESYGAKLAAE